MFGRTRFEARSSDILMGFDERGRRDHAGNIPYQMIPVDSGRVVRLQDADGVTLDTTWSGIVDISCPANGKTRDISLQGLKPGRCLVIARRNGKTVASLEVSVKPLRTLRVMFFFVTDADNQRTKRSQSSLPQIIGEINFILRQQANICVTEYGIEEFRVPFSLGRKVIDGRQRDEMRLISDYRHRLADATVFFVPEIENRPRILDALQGIAYDGAVLVEDDVGCDDSRVIAHELVHHMLLHVVNPRSTLKDHIRGRRGRGMLMYDSVSGGGRKLNAAQIDALNGDRGWRPPEDLRG
jgi:hypothetical protein